MAKQVEVKILTCENCTGKTCKEVPTKFAYYDSIVNRNKITRLKYRERTINIILREFFSRKCKLQAVGIAFELCPSVELPQGYKTELNSRYRMEYGMKKFTEDKIKEKIEKLFTATKHFVDLAIDGELDPKSRMNKEKSMLEEVNKIVKIKISSEYEASREENHYLGWFGSICVRPNHLTGEYKMEIPVNKLQKGDVLHVVRAVAPFLHDKSLLKETI